MENTTQQTTQPDENQSLSERFSSDERTKYLKIGGAVTAIVAVAIAVFAVYSSLQKDNAAAAALALSRVQDFYNAGEYDKALDGPQGQMVRGQAIIGLKEIASKYSSVEPGKVASLYAGTIYLNKEQFADAERAFDAASASSDDLVRGGAIIGIASAKEAQGQLAEAATLYEKAADILAPFEQDGRALLCAALIYKGMNNVEKSRALTEKLLAKGEFSEFAGQAKSLMAQLNYGSGS